MSEFLVRPVSSSQMPVGHGFYPIIEKVGFVLRGWGNSSPNNQTKPYTLSQRFHRQTQVYIPFAVRIPVIMIDLIAGPVIGLETAGRQPRRTVFWKPG